MKRVRDPVFHTITYKPSIRFRRQAGQDRSGPFVYDVYDDGRYIATTSSYDGSMQEPARLMDLDAFAGIPYCISYRVTPSGSCIVLDITKGTVPREQPNKPRPKPAPLKRRTIAMSEREWAEYDALAQQRGVSLVGLLREMMETAKETTYDN